jgi:acetyl esterase/lipase
MAAWLLLLSSIYTGIYTLNAFVPLSRGRLRFVWGFVSSWLTIEAALFHVVWQMALVAVLVWVGALSMWPGWVGLALFVVSWTGLAMLYIQSHRVGPAVNAVLETIGADTSMKRYRRTHLRLTRKIEFGRAGGRRLHLDVMEPAAPAAEGVLRPAIVQIHGGGWVIGFKERQGMPLMRHLAANGWVVFNVDYRLSPAATWPDHLVDCKAAVAWVRAHAADYGIDPSFVAVTGGSAGGHLTAMMALTADDERYQPGFTEADTSVQVAVPFYGVYDLTNRSGQFGPELHRDILEPLVIKAFFDDTPELFADASPIILLERAIEAGTDLGIPPMLLIHGDRDTLTPVSDARVFASLAAQASSNEVVYLELPGAQHAFDSFRSRRTHQVVRGVHRFVDAAWRRHQRKATGEPSQASGGDAIVEGDIEVARPDHAGDATVHVRVVD